MNARLALVMGKIFIVVGLSITSQLGTRGARLRLREFALSRPQCRKIYTRIVRRPVSYWQSVCGASEKDSGTEAIDQFIINIICFSPTVGDNAVALALIGLWLMALAFHRAQSYHPRWFALLPYWLPVNYPDITVVNVPINYTIRSRSLNFILGV